MDLSHLLALLKNIGVVLLNIVLFGVGGLLIGTIGMFIGLTLLQYGLGASTGSPEVGLVSFFWAFAAAVVFGILGGILGLVLGIRWARKTRNLSAKDAKKNDQILY